MPEPFRLDDRQWSRLVPLLPNDRDQPPHHVSGKHLDAYAIEMAWRMEITAIIALSICLALMTQPGLAQPMPDFGMVGPSVAGVTLPVVLNPCPTGWMAANRSQATAAATCTAYTPTPALAEQTKTALLGRLCKINPEAAQGLSGRLARNDYQAVWRSLAKGTGMLDGNAADAKAAYTVLSWIIATDARTDSDPAAFAGVRAEIAPLLASKPRLGSEGAMAALGEEMKLQAVVVHAGWQSARREGRSSAYAGGVAAEFRRTSGQDIQALVLMPDGFASRKPGR